MKFTVYQINPETHAKIRPLFTGLISEAQDAIAFLVEKHNWNIKYLGLLDETTGRWVSFNQGQALNWR